MHRSLYFLVVVSFLYGHYVHEEHIFSLELSNQLNTFNNPVQSAQHILQ